jgi:CBS domain-containing protein
MTRDVEVISPEASIEEAVRKMDQLNVGPLPVCDGRKLVGMVTDRDITVRERQSECALAQIPVVVVSAAPQNRLLERKEPGTNALLSKPFDLDAFSALLSTYAS